MSICDSKISVFGNVGKMPINLQCAVSSCSAIKINIIAILQDVTNSCKVIIVHIMMIKCFPYFTALYHIRIACLWVLKVEAMISYIQLFLILECAIKLQPCYLKVNFLQCRLSRKCDKTSLKWN